MSSWVAYRPPWYPDLGPLHNPLAMNGQEGASSGTKYGDWTNTLKPGELAKLIAAARVERT